MRPTDAAPRAARYDEPPPVGENCLAVFDLLMREGDLRGRRILEPGGRAVIASFARRWLNA